MASIDTSQVHRRACYFTGQVQGVGFRYTTKNIALRHNVQGYVRNLPDGRVELVMEGEDPEMDRMVQEIGQRMANFIDNIHHATEPATGEFEYFAIRH